MQANRIDAVAVSQPPDRRSLFIWIVGWWLFSMLGIGTNLSAEEISPQSVIDSLQAFREQHGRAPGVNDFLAMVTDPAAVVKIPRTARREVWNAFVATQQGSVSKQDLAELHKAVRDSLHDMRMIVHWRQTSFAGGIGQISADEHHDFALSGRKLYLGTERQSGSPQAETVNRGFDEQLLRVYQKAGKAKAGTIAMPSTRTTFFRPESNLLFGTMLLDSVDATGQPLRFHDLQEFLKEDYVVFEAPFTWEGESYLVVGDLADEVWLDPNRNYAVVRFVSWNMPEDAPRRLRYECELSNFTDSGNGIWLPHKMVRRQYSKEHGTLLTEDVTEVVELHVNEGVPDSLFSEVIPTGSIVLDSVKDLTYRSGEAGSIESLMDRATPLGNRPKSRIALLVVCNVIVLAILLAFPSLRTALKSRRHPS